MIFLYLTNMILLCQKFKYDLLPKNDLKNDIYVVIERYYIHPSKYGISSDTKIKDDQKVYSVKYI